MNNRLSSNSWDRRAALHYCASVMQHLCVKPTNYKPYTVNPTAHPKPWTTSLSSEWGMLYYIIIRNLQNSIGNSLGPILTQGLDWLEWDISYFCTTSIRLEGLEQEHGEISYYSTIAT